MTATGTTTWSKERRVFRAYQNAMRTSRTASGRRVQASPERTPASTQRPRVKLHVAARAVQQSTGASMPPTAIRPSRGKHAKASTARVQRRRSRPRSATSKPALTTSHAMFSTNEARTASAPIFKKAASSTA